ncbi:DUF3892 domain-containing protein [Oxalobacteraceae bacterium A2-2]
MTEYEINCVRKLPRRPYRRDPHEQITHIGNTHNQWMITRESAIDRIASMTQAFYVADEVTGERFYVAVVIEAKTEPYLRAPNQDELFNDELLMLRACGDDCELI